MKNRPFLKWAGSKYRILDKIIKEFPGGDRLVEPFVGSGAVFLNCQYKKYYLAETNPDLINLFKILKAEGDEFIEYAQSYMQLKNNTEKRYYQFRDEFNQTQDIRKKSALFIYLNRHGYNGLCRYNQSWQFNVPFGSYRKPYFPQIQLEHFHQHAQKAQFVCQDFRQSFKKLKTNDIVYCDPPYAPLTETANFTSYGGNKFTESDQEDLVVQAELCREKGIPVIISNHDTPYTRRLYRNAKIKTFTVQRTIGRDALRRVRVKELLALYLPED